MSTILEDDPTLIRQPFSVEDEFGTVMTMPLETTLRLPLAVAPLPPPSPAEGDVFPMDDDPTLRLERKLDAAMRQISVLQQRLESIDQTLARVLSR